MTCSLFLGGFEFYPWARWSYCSSTCSSEDIPAYNVRQRVCAREDGDCKGETYDYKPCDKVKKCPGLQLSLCFRLATLSLIY